MSCMSNLDTQVWGKQPSMTLITAKRFAFDVSFGAHKNAHFDISIVHILFSIRELSLLQPNSCLNWFPAIPFSTKRFLSFSFLCNW